MKYYIKLMRPFHWVKNLLIFVPLFFNGRILSISKVWLLIVAFLAFSFIASSVYILNDVKDADKDRLHPKKRFRPIASGKVSKKQAVIFWIFLFTISILLMGLIGNIVGSYLVSFILPLIYLLMNLLYSNGLKNIPLVDVSIIAAGFVIRLYYGALVCGVTVSDVLLLTVISASFFLGFGKRRNELKKVLVLVKFCRRIIFIFLIKLCMFLLA